MLNKKRKAFTLAEVLITLGIIGVVAAMTIPTLIANTKSQQYRSQFKKTLSTLNQAVRMSSEQQGFDFSSDATSMGHVHEIFQKTLTGYTLTPARMELEVPGCQYEMNCYRPDFATHDASITDHAPTIVLSDGSFLVISRGNAAGCTKPIGQTLAEFMEANPFCVGYIDVNGYLTGPNKEVTCTEGTTSKDVTVPCVVKNNATNMTDIFPVAFYDQTMVPASNAAQYVLNSTK